MQSEALQQVALLQAADPSIPIAASLLLRRPEREVAGIPAEVPALPTRADNDSNDNNDDNGDDDTLRDQLLEAVELSPSRSLLPMVPLSMLERLRGSSQIVEILDAEPPELVALADMS